MNGKDTKQSTYMPKNMNEKNVDQYTHYQEYFNNFLGAWSFQNGDEVVTITGVRVAEMFDAQTGGQKRGLVIDVKEKELPIVLNKTNAAMIAEVTGSDVMGDWVGQKIVIGTERVKAFGKVTEAIRVRAEKPKEARPASEAQKTRIEAMIADGTINEPALLKYLKISDLEALTHADALNVIRAKTGEVVE